MKRKLIIWILIIIFLLFAVYLSFYQKKYEGKEIFSNDFEIDETSFLIWDSGQKSSKDFSHEDIVKLKNLLISANYKGLSYKKSNTGFKLRYEMTAKENDKNYIIEIYDNGVLQLFDFHNNYWYAIDKGFEEIIEFLR